MSIKLAVLTHKVSCENFQVWETVHRATVKAYCFIDSFILYLLGRQPILAVCKHQISYAPACKRCLFLVNLSNYIGVCVCACVCVGGVWVCLNSPCQAHTCHVHHAATSAVHHLLTTGTVINLFILFWFSWVCRFLHGSWFTINLYNIAWPSERIIADITAWYLSCLYKM